MQVLNKVITVYAALCSEVKKLKYEVSVVKQLSYFVHGLWLCHVYVCILLTKVEVKLLLLSAILVALFFNFVFFKILI